MPARLDSCYAGRRVLVTGHTGFKGGWLVTWLKRLGSRVAGFALPPEPDRPSFFEAAQVACGMTSLLGDVRDPAAVGAAFREHRPEIVFHLAAQSLVRRSYRLPAETFATNVMGTVHVLEAVRRAPSVRAVVIVTSDKCYAPCTTLRPHTERDALGGRDPYSASKAAAELVAAAYREAFFSAAGAGGHAAAVASARAGNVIGGGDWAEDRLVPDCMRALAARRPIAVRHPDAIRPWQHVLEPLSGYLRLAARLWAEPQAYAGAWNFGPRPEDHISVRGLVDQIVGAWGAGEWREERDPDAVPETDVLALDCRQAATRLAWRPLWSVRRAVQHTVEWYRRFYGEPSLDAAALTVEQIDSYAQEAAGADAGGAL